MVTSPVCNFIHDQLESSLLFSSLLSTSDSINLPPTRKQPTSETITSPPSDNMGYPDTFEGFMVNSQEDWTTFKKQEVRRQLLLATRSRTNEHADVFHSSNPRSSDPTTSISRSTAAVSVALTSIPSMAAGEKPLCPFALVTRSLAMPSRSATR